MQIVSSKLSLMFKEDYYSVEMWKEHYVLILFCTIGSLFNMSDHNFDKGVALKLSWDNFGQLENTLSLYRIFSYIVMSYWAGELKMLERHLHSGNLFIVGYLFVNFTCSDLLRLLFVERLWVFLPSSALHVSVLEEKQKRHTHACIHSETDSTFELS